MDIYVRSLCHLKAETTMLDQAIYYPDYSCDLILSLHIYPLIIEYFFCTILFFVNRVAGDEFLNLLKFGKFYLIDYTE